MLVLFAYSSVARSPSVASLSLRSEIVLVSVLAALLFDLGDHLRTFFSLSQLSQSVLWSLLSPSHLSPFFWKI